MSKIPKLRFSTFNGEWQVTKLSDLVTKITKKNKDFAITNVISNSAKNGLVSQREFFDKDIANQSNINGYYIIQKGDFVYNPRKSNESPYGPVNMYLLDEPGIVSPLYLCFEKAKDISNDFLAYYFKSNKWHRFIYLNSDQGVRHDRVSIKDADFFNLDIAVPSIIEQEKIASFFALLDKRIDQQEEKVKQLFQYQEGMMQRIFTGDCRFKDEECREYPEWKKSKLGDLGQTYTGLSGKTKEDFGSGDGKFVTYLNVFNNIVANQEMVEAVQIIKGENQNEVQKGDLFFTTSSETPDEVGMVSCWNYDQENVYLNSFCFGYRVMGLTKLSPIFLAYLLRSREYRRKISILAQGSTRYNISKNALMEIEVEIPCLEEQLKITKYLLLQESRAHKEKVKLQLYHQLKKGLLMQMFA